jgi:formamidopyrimidine-DNA glycosylase
VPELPDVTVYVEHLRRRVSGTRLVAARATGLNLLRTFDPPLETCDARLVQDVSRLGKRIVFALEGARFLVLHLMIAGRLHWRERGGRPAGRALATFEFERGTLTLTENSKRQRAALHVLAGAGALRSLDAGGLEPLGSSLDAFRERLLSEDHTLKRALTDPRLFSGIGNAYSDEIFHRARVSPLRRTRLLDDPAIAQLHEATLAVLTEWTERLRAEAGDAFPEKVTAFRDGMAVHGRYRQPCPACGTKVQRIRYAENETNYCPRCQTEGRLLADRALSRLLREDWPKTIEELEERTSAEVTPSRPDVVSANARDRSRRGSGSRRR